MDVVSADLAEAALASSGPVLWDALLLTLNCVDSKTLSASALELSTLGEVAEVW